MTQPVQPSHLVVIGSSAGGIEALSEVVATLPADLRAAVVIAQHLDPKRESRLQEILERRSTLPVRMVAERATLVAGEVFVVASNHDVTITNHSITLTEPSGVSSPSVDVLFRSAADAFGENLIAVVLTGTGSDGAVGARVVHEADGTVIVQNPETAAYPEMPRSLEPVTVDFIAELSDIGRLLDSITNTPEGPGNSSDQEELGGLLADIRSRRGLDFSEYRRGTIMRRLQRRMLATNMRSIADYRAYVRGHPEEGEHLVSGLLISVTEFFRDPDTFEYLGERILPDLMARARGRGEELRLWSAGCATGEEAYSLAILTLEQELGQDVRTPVRIFATDVATNSIDFARRGVYPAKSLARLPPEMVDRYFTQVDGEYEVRKAVRERIVFGEHDLTSRAPFPDIDLVMCRNVLMYFTGELQRRVLQAFAFSLREGGYLVLGTAENVRPLADAFAPDVNKLRIFRRTGERAVLDLSSRNAADQRIAFSRSRLSFAAQSAEDDGPLERRRRELDDLVQRLPVGVVLVNRRYDIQHINSTARALFGIHGLAMGEDLIHLLESIAAGELRQAIDAAFSEGTTTTLQEVATAEMAMGEARHLQITCMPRAEPSGPGSVASVLITVMDVTSTVRQRLDLEEEAQTLRDEMERLTGMMRRLTETNERLIGANSELADLEETLRETSARAEASNEELEASNEELQASNEELETLNEELKATVEELEISNSDLDARGAELVAQHRPTEEARAQLAAILTTMPDAVAVVHESGRVMRTNPAYDALLATMGGDLEFRDERGEPLPDHETPFERVRRGESFKADFRLMGTDGRLGWFEADGRQLPTPTEAGGVLIIRDVTERMARRFHEQMVSVASHELRTPLTALMGYQQRLLKLLRNQNIDGVLETVATSAFHQGRRMERLISELLDVSRIERGALNVARDPISLGSVASAAIDQVRAFQEDRVVTLEQTEGDVLLIRGDTARLETVLLNMLTNAFKHSPDDTTVQIRLRRVDAWAEVKVEDRGEGIPAVDLPHVFERFYQGRSRGTGDGLGIGLYLAREVVAAHGGEIDVVSEEGQGTTFTVRLPLLDAAPEQSA